MVCPFSEMAQRKYEYISSGVVPHVSLIQGERGTITKVDFYEIDYIRMLGGGSRSFDSEPVLQALINAPVRLNGCPKCLGECDDTQLVKLSFLGLPIGELREIRDLEIELGGENPGYRRRGG